MTKDITNFHDLTKKYPERFSKRLHRQVYFIEQLLKRKDIEYKPTDPDHFEEFCKDHIKHIEGVWAGQPLILSIEQKWIIHCILGLKEKHKEYKVWIRYFKECRILVSRKWGKSLIASALIIWFTACDKEPAAQNFCLASNMEQAARVYEIAMSFIEQSRTLKALFKSVTKRNKKFAYVKGTDNFFSFNSGSAKGKAGSNPHLAIFDELHEITNVALYKNVVSGQGARLQPMTLSISSAGTTRNCLFDINSAEIDHLCKMTKLDEDIRMFFACFEIDPQDDPDNQSVWIKANPGLKENRPSISFLRKEHKHSLLDVTARPIFLAQNLNRPSNNAMTYITLDEIKNARIDITQEMYYDAYAFGGTDLSQTTDLCCATALIPTNEVCTQFVFLQQYFVAEKRLEQNSERDKVLYGSFQNTTSKDPLCRELLRVCKGAIVDKEDVVRWFVELEEKYKITFLKIGFDPWDKTEYLKYSLLFFPQEITTKDENGILLRDEGVMTEVRQGAMTLSEPIKIIKTSFTDGEIFYDNTNALFEFCVNNLKVTEDNNKNLTINKAKSTGRIDGFASLLDAYVAMERGKESYLSLKKTHNIYQSGEKSLDK